MALVSPMEYSLVGGELRMAKAALIQELLVADSVLRALLNWKPGAAFSAKHPALGEVDGEGMVPIRFDQDSGVVFDESPWNLVARLSARYPGKVTGRLICRSLYLTHFSSYVFQIQILPDGQVVESAPQ